VLIKFRVFIKNAPGPETYLQNFPCPQIYQNCPALGIFYKPAHARLRIKETEAGRCILNYIAHIHCSLFVCLADFDLLAAINCPADQSQVKGGERVDLLANLILNSMIEF
jgi:hypothetical protein